MGAGIAKILTQSEQALTTNYKPKAIEVQTCRSARAKLEAVLKESKGAEAEAKGGEQ